MPFQLTRAKRKLTSLTTRDYSGPSKCKGPKVLKLSQMQKQRRELDDRRKKTEHCKFCITFCERTCIDFIPTGLTALICQKIAEAGMIANKSPSAIDWTIISDIPDASILNEYMNMNIDLQFDEWEDVVEDDAVTNMQDEIDKTAARHATLQTTILCIILIFLPFFSFLFFSFLNFTVVHLAVAERAACHSHVFYDTKLQRGNVLRPMDYLRCLVLIFPHHMYHQTILTGLWLPY